MKKLKHIPKHRITHHESIKYVMLNNPTYLRKDILLNALDVVKVLKEFESFNQLKARKFKMFGEVNSIMDEIHDSFLALHRKLPIDESLKQELHKKMELARPENLKERIQAPRKLDYTEEDKLKDELRLIETRLRRMNI